jgi:hypothetical protein
MDANGILRNMKLAVEHIINNMNPCNLTADEIKQQIEEKSNKLLSWTESFAVKAYKSIKSEYVKMVEMRTLDNLERMKNDATFIGICNGTAYGANNPERKKILLKTIILDYITGIKGTRPNPDEIVLINILEIWRAENPEISQGGRRRSIKRRRNQKARYRKTRIRRTVKY